MRRSTKRILRIGGITIGILAGLVIAAVLLLEWKTDDIAARLLDGANKEFPGEFELEKAELRLLRYLPNITLQLAGVKFRERKGDPNSEILAVDRMLVAINPFKLLSNEIRLTALELDSGYIRLIHYRDSTTNISRALGPITSVDSAETKRDSAGEQTTEMAIEIKNLSLLNVHFEAIDETSGFYVKSTLEKLEDKLVYNDQEIDNQLSLGLYLDEMRDSTRTLLSDQRVELETDLNLDRNNLIASFKECWLSLNGAAISLTGTYDLANKGDADLKFETRNAHLNVFTLLTNQVLVLPEDRITLDGQLALDGEIKGQTLGGQLPFVRFDFSSENISLFDKADDTYILSDMDCRLSFTTGQAQDLSELILEMDTLHVEFPGGFIRGALELKDVTRPRLKLQLLADNDMSTLQKILNPQQISGLRGQLKTDIDLNIKLDPQTGEYDRNFGTSSIEWVNGAFNLPSQELTADLINVALISESNSFEITNFNLVRGSSDFVLAGSLNNAISYLLKDPVDLKGELRLETDKLRLYDFIDSTLVPGISPEFYNLASRITLAAPHEARRRGEPPLTGVVLSLERFETESNVFAPIRNISGDVTADNRQIRLSDWLGVLGDSDVRFDVRLSSEKDLFNKYIRLQDLRLDYDFASKTMRAADFFTFMDQFYLPEAYRDEVLMDFRLKGYVKAERPDSIEYAQIPDLRFLVEDLRLRLSSYPVSLRDCRIDLLKDECNAEIAAFQAKIGESNFRMSGELVNFFTPPNETPRTLSGRLSLSSTLISTGDFMDASGVLDFTPELYDLNTEMRLHMPAGARSGSGNLSGTYLELSNFNSRSNFIADIKKISGRVVLEKNGVLLEKWRGVLGQSGVTLDMALRGLPPALSEQRPVGSITLDYKVLSERVRATDLFTFRDSFYFPAQFQDEEMQNLILEGQVVATGKAGEPDSKLQLRIDELEWDLTLFPVAFRDFAVDMTIRPREAVLQNFAGKIGRSDFKLEGRVANFHALTGNDDAIPELELSVASNRLDLNELMQLYLPTLQQAAEIESGTSGATQSTPQADLPSESADLGNFNVFALPIPEGYLDLRIDTVRFQQSTFQGIKGILRTSTSRKIALENLEAIVASGHAGLTGQLDLSDPDSAALEVNALIKDAVFDELTDPIVYGGESFVPADHFRGVFNTSASISTRLLPDLGLDVTNATGDISLSLVDGEVVDFAPLQMLSSFMGSKDLSQVRFDSLENNLQLEDGYIFIPKMDVNSTIGAIRITGFQYFNMEMEYLVQIPLSLVTSVGWSTLTGKKRKEDAAPDEIVKMKDGGARVNIRIEGTMDDYKIKLGKGETFKAIEKEEKKKNRKKANNE